MIPSRVNTFSERLCAHFGIQTYCNNFVIFLCVGPSVAIVLLSLLMLLAHDFSCVVLHFHLELHLSWIFDRRGCVLVALCSSSNEEDPQPTNLRDHCNRIAWTPRFVSLIIVRPPAFSLALLDPAKEKPRARREPWQSLTLGRGPCERCPGTPAGRRHAALVGHEVHHICVGNEIHGAACHSTSQQALVCPELLWPATIAPQSRSVAIGAFLRRQCLGASISNSDGTL